MTDRIKVSVRIRPSAVDGAASVVDDAREVFNWSDHRLCPLVGKEAARGKDGYLFQRVFPPGCNNSDVYGEVRDLASAPLEGVNGCVLAYGQTASGKTHTMRGNEMDAGVTPRLVDELFGEIARRTNWSYKVQVAYFEIYNEHVYDLLSTTTKDLELYGDEVQGLQYLDAPGAEEAKEALKCGEDNRSKARTDMNEHSSRSHTIFKIVVTGVCGNKRRRGQLHLVDLAGSENAKAAGTTGDTRREGGAINRSLLALTSVIHGLAAKQSHIPFRDSKLTRILQNSLGGNARTRIVCCVTACRRFFDETMSTIHFAERAKVVYNAVRVDEVDGAQTIPFEAFQEILQMYQDDMATAMTREMAIHQQHSKEVISALEGAAEEADANHKMYLELDEIMQAKVYQLTNEVAKVQSEADGLREEVKTGVELLKQEKHDHEESKMASVKKVAELEKTVDDLQNQCELVKEENEFVKQAHKHSLNEIEENQLNIQRLESDVTEIKKREHRLVRELDSSMNQLAHIQEEILRMKRPREVADPAEQKRARMNAVSAISHTVQATHASVKLLLQQSCETRASLAEPTFPEVDSKLFSMGDLPACVLEALTRPTPALSSAVSQKMAIFDEDWPSTARHVPKAATSVAGKSTPQRRTPGKAKTTPGSSKKKPASVASGASQKHLGAIAEAAERVLFPMKNKEPSKKKSASQASGGAKKGRRRQ